MTAARARRAPRLDVQVTQEHIDNAIRRDSGHCMIADAVRDAIPSATWVSVDLATIRYTDEARGQRFIYLTPGYAQKALLQWDDGVKPEPFRIRQNAAQIVMTGAARKARRLRNRMIRESGGKVKPERATTQTPQDGDPESSVPVKVGGRPIPIGQLASAAVRDGRDSRRGKRREFGLRRFVR